MITIYGASGHAKVIYDIIIENGIPITAIVDDNEFITDFRGYKVLTTSKLTSDSIVVIGVGNNEIRKSIADRILSNVALPLIHPTVTLSNNVTIGEGTVIMATAVVNSSAQIGNHCIINTGVIIEHDCIIRNFSHVSPGAVVTGGVDIGEGTHIGAGAIILPNLKIGNWSVIGAGAVVTKDIADNTVVVGNPAKFLKKRI